MCKYKQGCCCQKSDRSALASCKQPPFSLCAPNLTENIPQREPTGFYVAWATLFAVGTWKWIWNSYREFPLENKVWLHCGVVLRGAVAPAARSRPCRYAGMGRLSGTAGACPASPAPWLWALQPGKVWGAGLQGPQWTRQTWGGP